MTDFNYSPALTFDLLAFMRDDTGTPLYGLGLHNFQVDMTMAVDLIVPKELKEYEGIDTMIYNQIQTYLNSEMDKFRRAVLCDNDDQFLRNMIPPHNYTLMNGMFSDLEPVLFTPGISPPPTRLNFPFLVGRNEKDLLGDLWVMFNNYFNTNMKAIGLTVRGINFTPVESISISAPSGTWK